MPEKIGGDFFQKLTGMAEKVRDAAEKAVGEKPTPRRLDLAARETITCHGVELQRGDKLYAPYGNKGGYDIWEIQYWDNKGVVLRPIDADQVGLKDRLLGRADERKCTWDQLDKEFSPTLPERPVEK